MRAPRSAVIGVLVVLLGISLTGRESPPDPGAALPMAPTAVVSWPVSAGLLVAEVVTGGASASDEYVEITNAGSAPLDLAGHEIVYVTASGATTTRKAAWAEPVIVEPGRHVLIANALGPARRHRGRHVQRRARRDRRSDRSPAHRRRRRRCRRVGGRDEWLRGGWRRDCPARQGARSSGVPGGPAGNGADSNDNAADWVVLGQPVPQPLAAPPAPGPSADPDPRADTDPGAQSDARSDG